MPSVKDPRISRLVVIGVCAGFLSGLLGVGGGIVIVPLLVLWLGWNQKQGQATSLGAVFFISIYAATTYALQGHVDFKKGVLIGVPALAGVLVGTRLAAKLQSDTLGLMFAGFQVVVAILLFVN